MSVLSLSRTRLLVGKETQMNTDGDRRRETGKPGTKKQRAQGVKLKPKLLLPRGRRGGVNH